MEHNFNNKCYIDKNKTITKFIPETNPIESNVNYDVYERYFPKVSKNIDFTKLKMSNIGFYSMVKPEIAEKVCKIIIKLMNSKNITVTDALGNMGGFTLTLAKYFSHINVCEIVKEHCHILENNIKIYGFQQKINLYCADYFDYMYDFEQEIILFDPPWGGTDYSCHKYLNLSINNVNIICVIKKLLDRAKYILLIVPYNYNFSDITILDTALIIKKIKKGNKPIFLIIIKGRKTMSKSE